jgi:dTDP-4-dehydrorhamnose reductase
MLDNKRIFITGVSGQLGSWLHRLLSCTNAVLYYGSRLDITYSFQRALSSFKPDIIINCAAYTKVDAAETYHKAMCFNSNAYGVKNIADWIRCNSSPCKLVQISTDYVFGDCSRAAIKCNNTWNEQSDPVPDCIYGWSKFLGEQYALQCKDVVIIRTSGLYGHAASTKQTSFVQAMLNHVGDRVYVVDDQSVSPTYTKHLAEAIISLLSKHPYNETKLFHIANTGSYSWAQFAEAIFSIAGIKKHVVRISTAEYMKIKGEHLAKRPLNSSLDCDLFHRQVDHKMPTVEQGLRDYINHLNEHGVEYART